MKTYIRWMGIGDVGQLLEIERQSFDVPWDQRDFKRAIKSRDMFGIVAEHHHTIVGYAVIERRMSGKLTNALHISNLAVVEPLRKQGIGRQLIERTIDLARPNNCDVTLDVRESNLGAQLFFRSLQFRATAIIHDAYEQSEECAYHFRFPLGIHPTNRIRHLVGST